MTLPVTGPISLNNVNVELGLAGTTLISLNQANVRTLAGVPTPLSTISMSNLRGKTNRVTVTVNMITGNVSGVTINSIPGYVAGITDAIINVPAGVYLFTTSSNLSFGGLQIYGGTAGDTLTINNSGAIMGIGGNGGTGGVSGVSTAGSPGGPALIFNHTASVPVQLNNYGYILGGGGGGAGGRDGGSGNGVGGGGGGAGGGAGGGIISFANGGLGGTFGSSGNAGDVSGNYYAGAGGGRVAPGSRTTPPSAASVGGSAGGSSGGLQGGRVGKYGGGPGEVGQQSNIDTSINTSTGAGGGGWGAAGGSLRSAFNTGEIHPGGAAGAAVVQNGRTVTINNPGAIYGAII